MNNLVLCELAGSRRGKTEPPARGVGTEIELRRVAFGGNEVRPVQKSDRLLTLSSIFLWQSKGFVQ